MQSLPPTARPAPSRQPTPPPQSPRQHTRRRPPGGNTGLIEPAQVEAAECERPKAPLRTVEAAIATLTYDQVYNLLTSQAKERLGLVKGFMFVLEVEKCANEAELRALAVRFVGMVRDAQGDSAAKMMRMALGVET